tara:strand:+ start:75 stop:455 length:381 start_codon:yes stop_codon:yes gene_type:complete
MANPSVTNATAVGKEVIRRTYLDGLVESEQTLLTGVANHIMTIISIILCSRNDETDCKFSMYIDADSAGSDIYLLNGSCGNSNTFTWTDRFAITETDKLHLIASSVSGTAQYDVWCTYIDQQFAAP